MFRSVMFALVLVLSLASCTSSQPPRLKISATTWIGYSPLFYAKEKGWLKPLNIKLLNVSSLSENMYLYEAGNADAYVGTQYEYSLIVKKDPSLMPIILFDRSYGGDMILSNATIDTLTSSPGTIDAYLELDSINSTLLNDFIQRYALDRKRINYINMDQAQISTLQSKDIKRDALVVTYIPYDVQLRKKGFAEIASTKNNLDLLVVDALFTTEKKFNRHKKQFIALKKLVDDAVVALKSNPEEFYQTISHYMLELSYEEFIKSLDDIIWINKTVSSKLEKRIRKANFPTRNLI